MSTITLDPRLIFGRRVTLAQLEKKFTKLEDTLGKTFRRFDYPERIAQVVHGDLTSFNIEPNGNRVVGVIDDVMRVTIYPTATANQITIEDVLGEFDGMTLDLELGNDFAEWMVSELVTFYDQVVNRVKWDPKSLLDVLNYGPPIIVV